MRTNRRSLPVLSASLLLLSLPLLLAPTDANAIDGGRSGQPHSRRVELFEDSRANGPDLPARIPRGGSRADTLWFGYVQTVGGALYAVPGETWTFDHGTGGAEGWYAVDARFTDSTPARHISTATWGGHGNLASAPIPAGDGALWFGLFEDEADAFCWESGLGYGNSWCLRHTSPEISYVGSGDVLLEFDYFNDTEPAFDYSVVSVRFQDGTTISLNGNGFDDRIGDPGVGNYAHGAFVIGEALLAGHGAFRIEYGFTADGGYSDEDGDYVTDYGPFAVDNVSLSGAGMAAPVGFDFELGPDGWLPSACRSATTFFGIADASEYSILDPCSCALAGKVLEMHDGSGNAGTHPQGQHERAFSPPADLSALPSGCRDILAAWDQYSILPQANGVFYRPGWNYFPYVCPATGEVDWSGRAGQDTYFYVGAEPACAGLRNVGTEYGIPSEAEQVSFCLEVYSSCDAFGVPPSICTGVTNATPLFDNVRIGVTSRGCAPTIAFEVGGAFQDGFGQGLKMAVDNVGNADCTYDLHRDLSLPDKLGDSLFVRGPLPTVSTRWEARLWWRLRREGPAAASISGYTAWKDAVRDGRSIVGPAGEFTFGWMDSTQSGTAAARHRFCSEFREDDDDFTGEGTNNNEMIRDGILAPGTQIEYFVTSNYTCTPSACYLLPDTAGGNFLEFEILPSWRMDGGIAKYPSILVVDLDRGEQTRVEAALNVVLNGAAPNDPIPNPTRWDRYDYADATSSWNAPLARSTGGNNGMTTYEFGGYRQLVLLAGDAPVGSMEAPDFDLIQAWLEEIPCSSTLLRAGVLGSGENLSELIAHRDGGFLLNVLGASSTCPNYGAPGCGPGNPADGSSCVRLESAGSAPYPPLLPVDLAGNGCPEQLRFDVLAPTTGVGNRVYNDYDRVPPVNTSFAQIAHSKLTPAAANYRTVLNGYSLSRLSTRGAPGECGTEFDRAVPAIAEELRAALRWIFDGDGNVPGLWNDLCPVGDAEPPSYLGAGSRLLQNSPNPFNPRTSIRFALGAAGQARVAIYDAGGREVRLLADERLDAGEHTRIWDGTDAAGRRVPAGVYWSQLRTADYESQRKMVILR